VLKRDLLLLVVAPAVNGWNAGDFEVKTRWGLSVPLSVLCGAALLQLLLFDGRSAGDFEEDDSWPGFSIQLPARRGVTPLPLSAASGRNAGDFEEDWSGLGFLEPLSVPRGVPDTVSDEVADCSWSSETNATFRRSSEANDASRSITSSEPSPRSVAESPASSSPELQQPSQSLARLMDDSEPKLTSRGVGLSSGSGLLAAKPRRRHRGDCFSAVPLPLSTVPSAVAVSSHVSDTRAPSVRLLLLSLHDSTKPG